MKTVASHQQRLDESLEHMECTKRRIGDMERLGTRLNVGESHFNMVMATLVALEGSLNVMKSYHAHLSSALAMAVAREAAASR